MRTNNPPDSLAYSIDDFSRAFRIGRTLIYALIKQGKLTARKVNGRTIITADDAERWLDSLPTAGACTLSLISK